MALIVNTANAPTVDESSSLQNLTASVAASDTNDTDITVASINGTNDSGDLPDAFESRLFALLGSVVTAPLQVALSGYTGAVGNTGADLLTITSAYTDLAFTDAQGKLLGDATNVNGGADWSGLYTLDGTKIFLFTDPTNNNIVLGRVGNANGTVDPANDTPNATGTIVFAAYLDETKTATGGSAKVWMVQFSPLKHPGTADPDDAVDMTNHLWVAVSQAISFDFAGLPSGSNKFLMFKDSASDVGLIVTGMDPDKVNQQGNDVGDTVSTSQGGGPTTIGTNNQAIDPPKSGAPGEGMIFTFVNRPNPAFTVPNLTPTEADVEANIDYDYDPTNTIPAGQEMFGAGGASINIAQQTPPKAATARISAYNTGFEEQTNYFEGLLTNDTPVNIESVTVRNASGTIIAGLDHVTSNTTVGNVVITFTVGAVRTATIGGFETGYTLEYTVTGTHNRVLVENVGGPQGSSPFDIGGFSLPNTVVTPEEIGSQLNFEDDGPKILGTDARLVDEDGLTGGNPGGLGDNDAGNTDGDNNEATAAGVLSTLFGPGADGLGTYGFDETQLGAIKVYAGGDTNFTTPLALTSKGGTVQYDVVGNTLWGFVNVDGVATEFDGTDRAVFKLELSNLTTTGNYKFTLLDQLDHPTLNGAAGDDTENELVLRLGSVLKITDKDGDSRSGGEDSLVITVDDDTPVTTLATMTGTVDEDGVREGASDNGPGDGIAGGPAAAGSFADEAGEVVTASGNVSTLFSAGADEDLAYSLTTNGLTALGLKSGGVTVTYDVAFDAGTNLYTLTAAAGVGNTVFTMTLNKTTGAYVFTLVDQLDHATLNTVAGDNTENDLTIALGTAINATDFDGDAVTAAANGLVITVDDDTPIATINTVTGTVDEDGVREGASDTGPGDGIASGPTAAGSFADFAGEPVTSSGSISTLFESGADEALTYTLTTNGLSALGLKSAGTTVTYVVAFDAGTNLYTLTASAGAGNTVFTMTLHKTTGAYVFTLVDQLDHATLDTVAGDNTENDLAIALGTAIDATDFDGDTVTAAANGLVITVDDDTPIATVNTVTGTVDEDGVREGASDNGPGDGIAGGPTAAGSFADFAGAPVTSSGSISTLFQSGADEALTYALTVNGLDALNLKSGGVTVTYDVAFDAGTSLYTLTASAGVGNTVFTMTLHKTTGAYVFTLVDQLDHLSLDSVAGDNTENDLAIALGTAIDATDFDGDTVTAAANGLVITVDDDTPVTTLNTLTGTVDEDGVREGASDNGPGDGIAGGPAASGSFADFAGEPVTSSGNVSTLFQSGADEALAYSLTTNGLSALGLTSGGVTVTYGVAFDAGTSLYTLTASAGAGNTVFTMTLHKTTGAYVFTLVDQLDHATLDSVAGDNTENDLAIALGTAIDATDFDGDTVTAAANGLVITVDDDTPVVNFITNLVGFNNAAPMNGKYDFPIGADETGNTSVDGVILQTVTGTTSGGRAIITNPAIAPAPTITHQAEDATSVTYAFNFNYFTTSAPSTAFANATGTVTFNKVNGTYVFDLDSPIAGSTTFSTSGGTSLNYDTIGNNSPEITVKAYASDFFGVLSGQAASPPSDTTDLQTDDSDYTFAAGDTFKSSTTSYVNVATDTVGVDSDTIQSGELLNYDFYTSNPVSGATSPPQVPGATINAATPKAFVDKVDITLNQINLGKEDVAILLKLYNAGTNTFTTKLLLANAATDYQAVPNSTDVVVSVTESNYPAGFKIYGIQVLTSTENLTGTGFALSNNASVTLGSGGTDLADSSDLDVMKIIKIDVTVSRPSDADLQFTGKVVDADSDSQNFGFSVHLEGDSQVLAGGTGRDALNGTSAANTFTGGAGADVFMYGTLATVSAQTGITLATADTITDFSGIGGQLDTLQMGTAGTAANYAEAGPAADFATALAAATTAMNGTVVYYLTSTVADGGLLFVDSNVDGTADALIKLTGITSANFAFGDIVA